MARERWSGVSRTKRSEILRDAVNARWEKWRAENPEKAAASEVRREKRAAKKAVVKRRKRPNSSGKEKKS